MLIDLAWVFAMRSSMMMCGIECHIPKVLPPLMLMI